MQLIHFQCLNACLSLCEALWMFEWPIYELIRFLLYLIFLICLLFWLVIVHFCVNNTHTLMFSFKASCDWGTDWLPQVKFLNSVQCCHLLARTNTACLRFQVLQKDTNVVKMLIYYNKLAKSCSWEDYHTMHIKYVLTASFGPRFYIFHLLLWGQSHIFSYILSPDGIAASSSLIWSSLAFNSKK